MLVEATILAQLDYLFAASRIKLIEFAICIISLKLTIRKLKIPNDEKAFDKRQCFTANCNHNFIDSGGLPERFIHEQQYYCISAENDCYRFEQ